MHHHRFQDLPESIRHAPEFMAWQIADLQEQTNALRDRVGEIEHRPAMDSIKTPVGNLPLPLALGILGWLMWVYPEKVLRFIGLQ